VDDVKSYLLILLAALIGMSTGCSKTAQANVENLDRQAIITPAATAVKSASTLPAAIKITTVIPATITSIPTVIPSITSTLVPTNTPLSTPTLPHVLNLPEYVSVPILLYHHVSGTGYSSRYAVTPTNFRRQMGALRDWGYTTITPTRLIDVLTYGGELPDRPVIITFDDGYLDVYQNAFPIMKEMGFNGAFYIYVDHLQQRNFVNAEQLKEMVAAGWEIGSHSMTHIDLTSHHSDAEYEMLQSRRTLQEVTGEEINTFAYAYGKSDDFLKGKLKEYGYLGGIGLGMDWDHSLDSLFYLNRREVQGGYDLSTFEDLLPWSGN
jgi:peptidoglycan/xylan/chitin deacetylase (PgdA/CDA1 family)